MRARTWSLPKRTRAASVITANPDWSEAWHENGGEVWYFVNKDNIKTEERYAPMSGCREVIPASSNVGNAQVVFATQILGYDRYLLLGYDYSWGFDENYYSFNDGEKRYWMKHLQFIDYTGRMVNTSQNLLFSARWLTDFHKNFLSQRGITIVNCCGQGLLDNVPRMRLEKALNAKAREITQADRDSVFQSVHEETVVTTADVRKNPNALNEAIARLNVAEVVIKHVPDFALGMVGG